MKSKLRSEAERCDCCLAWSCTCYQWCFRCHRCILHCECKKKSSYSPTLPASDLESDHKHELEKSDRDQNLNPRVRIHVLSRRKRLADPAGISFKAAIDGLVRGGLLPSDSYRHVKSITDSQERADIEETVITIETVESD